MFDAIGAAGMFQWIQEVSLCSCAIAHHIELKEHSGEKTISKLRDKLINLREFYAKEICSLEGKVKKAEDKCLNKQKE